MPWFFFFTLLQIIIFLRKGLSSSFCHFVGVLFHQASIDLDLWRSQGRGSDELEVGVTNQLAGQPKERLLKVVVGLGGNVVVLEVLLSVESDGLGLDFTFLFYILVTCISLTRFIQCILP
jgi:hypothetical protein